MSPSLTEKERVSLLRLARTENVGPVSFFHLLKRYGHVDDVLRRLPSISRVPLRIPSLEDAQREFSHHDKRGYRLVSYYDKDYPIALKILKDAPPFLSMRGNTSVLQKTLFSIVGSRNASHAGEKIAETIALDLTKERWCIVSGLARGIDTVVHKASLSQGTVAVVAGGIDTIYPPENKALAQEIEETGVIISEDPLEHPAHASLFPKRNRLISALSWGTLIVEATMKSGSLLTANYALEQNKSLFAVPGHPLDPRSRGVNKLLKEGAILTENAIDIIQEYQGYVSQLHIAKEEEEEYTALTPYADSYDIDNIYTLIKQALTLVPISTIELAHRFSVPVTTVRSVLVEMELEGFIQRYPGDAVLLSGEHV